MMYAVDGAQFEVVGLIKRTKHSLFDFFFLT